MATAKCSAAFNIVVIAETAQAATNWEAQMSDAAICEAGVSTGFLDAFADAWNRHDTDAILAAMTDTCVFETSVGPTVAGTRYVGQKQTREGVEAVFEQFPDAQWNGPRHFIAGDRGVTEWVFTGTRSDGSRVEVQGCDVFTFRGGTHTGSSGRFEPRQRRWGDRDEGSSL